MYTVLLIFQVLLGVSIVVLVLLQHGKGADAGAAFGSGASATVFGAQGSANFLSRTTAVLATLFFINSIALSNRYVIGTPDTGSSVVERVQPLQEAAPAAPAEEEAAAPEDVPDVGVEVPADEAGQPGADEASDLPPVTPEADTGSASETAAEAPAASSDASAGEEKEAPPAADGKD